MYRNLLICGIIICAILMIKTARADIRLPSVIGSNMVLQREMPVPIWGWAETGEQVHVTLGSREMAGRADSSGAWMVKLPPMSAGGPFDLTIRGKNILELTNVMVGEVWCAPDSPTWR